ncbi:MAG: hypothetical protein IKP24_03600 [Alphaproteobacteria bacterium]|nr:hypothetical protein [Alphaproteobacteria bacterium]
MQNKNELFGLLIAVFALCAMPAYAVDEEFDEEEIVITDDGGDVVVGSVADYDVNGSLFQQITDLEQEKVLMELEKERAQLDLDLDRLAAEKIKLQMEMDTLSGRAEQEQQILQNEKSKLEAEAARIENEKRALAAAAAAADVATTDSVSNSVSGQSKKKTAPKKQPTEELEEDISTMYKLVNVMGAGNQLQATLSDLETGQTKRVSVGKKINGFTVKSISLEDGVVFTKDGETQNLNISSR